MSPDLPAPNHAIDLAYILDRSANYGNFRSEILSTVNTLIVWDYHNAGDTAELAASLADAALTGKKVIFGPFIAPDATSIPAEAITGLNVAVTYWSSISGIWFDENGGTKAQVEALITQWNGLVVARGKSPKPIWFNFAPVPTFGTTTGYQATNIDYVGQEVLVDPMFQNASDVVARVNTIYDAQKAVIGNRPSFIITQAYNRNGNWLNMDTLQQVQTPPYLKMYSDPTVHAVWMFSYGRPGGTRQLPPCIRREHLRIWGAITGSAQPPSISCAASVPSLACPPLTAAQVGVAFSSTLVVTGGVPPYTFSLLSGSLPTGLTLSSSTGTISGTPTTVQVASFSPRVVDGAGSTANTACSITVTSSASPLLLLCPNVLTGAIGTPYVSAVAAFGGVAPYTYSIVSGALPTGLVLTAATGLLSGTPSAAGAFPFTARATDSDAPPSTDDAACEIDIAPVSGGLFMLCPVQTVGTVGVQFDSAFSVGGGTAPLTFLLLSGAFPTGLDFDDVNGVVFGIPAAAGAYAFTVRVTDAEGRVHALACQIVINDCQLPDPCVPTLPIDLC